MTDRTPKAGSKASPGGAATGSAGRKPAGSGRMIVFGLVALALLAVLYLAVPLEAQLWVTAAHLFFVISWMIGFLYLPRLFVYHAEAGPGSPQGETFKVMERRLLRGIMTPSMLVTWTLGLWLAWFVYGFEGGWLHTKIALVVVLSGLHMFLAGSVRRFANDANTRTPRFWRIVNEVPAAILAIILILVIVKPF